MEHSTRQHGLRASDSASTSTSVRVFAALLTLLGVAALIWLTAQAGPAALFDSLRRVSTVLPHVIFLEVARVLAELWSMHALLGKHAALVPSSRLLRAQLLCSALSIVMPAGRAVGESARAATLTGAVPLPVAVATSALGQALTLAVNGSVGLLGALMAWQLGFVRFAAICFAYGFALLAAGVVLFVVMRSQRLAAVLARSCWTARLADPFVRAGRALRLASAGLARASLAQLLMRVFQAAQLALLAAALGYQNDQHAWADAPMLQVIYLLGAAAGDLVPAQLGAIDAAFALARPLLGMDAAAALALGLALHALQLLAAGICFLSRFVFPGVRAAASGGAHTTKPSKELA